MNLGTWTPVGASLALLPRTSARLSVSAAECEKVGGTGQTVRIPTGMDGVLGSTACGVDALRSAWRGASRPTDQAAPDPRTRVFPKSAPTSVRSERSVLGRRFGCKTRRRSMKPLHHSPLRFLAQSSLMLGVLAAAPYGCSRPAPRTPSVAHAAEAPQGYAYTEAAEASQVEEL